MLNELFVNDSIKIPIKSNTFRPKYNLKVESDKEYEMRMLKKLTTKTKLKKEYLDKLSTLLCTYKKDKNYSLKRNNIDKTIYKFNSDNILSVTLPKFYQNKLKNNKTAFSVMTSFRNNNNKQKFFRSITNDTKNNTFKDQLENFDDDYEFRNLKTLNNDNDFDDNKKEESNLTNSVKKLLYNDKNEIPLEQQKKIYIKFQNKINAKNNKSFLFNNFPKINVENNSLSCNKYYSNERNNQLNTIFTKSIPNLRYFNKNKKYFDELKLNRIYQKVETYNHLKKKNPMNNLFKSKCKSRKNERKLKGKELELEIFKDKKNNKLIDIEAETNQLVKQAGEIKSELTKTFSGIEKYLIHAPYSIDKES